MAASTASSARQQGDLMLRFDPNLRWMFTELPMLERYGAAAQAGFKGVEVAFPYEYPARQIADLLGENGLSLVQVLTPCDWAAGERGLAALPGREAGFRRNVNSSEERRVGKGGVSQCRPRGPP